MDAKLIKRFEDLPHDWQDSIENVLRLCLDSAEKQITADDPQRSARPVPSESQRPDAFAPLAV